MESNKNGKKNRHELLCLFLMLPFMFLPDALGVLAEIVTSCVLSLVTTP